MMFLNPVWFLLIVPVGVVWWMLPMPTRALRLIRAAICIAIILALCQPALFVPGPDGTVVVVADRSESMPAEGDESHKEVVQHLQDMAGKGRHLAVVAFGRKAAIESAGGEFAGFINDVGRDQSDLAAALDTAASLIPRNGVGRILVLSDGRWTGADPADVAGRCAARGIPIDYRWLRRPAANDLAIDRVLAPREVAPGGGFLINAWVQAPADGEISYQLERGGQVISSGRRQVESGLNRLTFRDLAGSATVLSYSLSIEGAVTDPVPENNRADILVGVKGGKPLLLVTDSKNSGLASLMARGGIGLEVKSSQIASWSLEQLAAYSAVVLENIRADALGPQGLRTVAAWIEHGGGGLLMTGGRRSYGQGGYFKSALDPVMPVSMEMRKEHRKFSVAVAIALDRSGSMAATVGGGKTKMDLANLGAVQVLDLLSDQDEIAVLAVDSSPHVIVGMSKVDSARGARNRILSSQSMGGGIFVYDALVGAAKEVRSASAGSRHIILFADAADAEEPGDYRELLAKLEQAGVTVSVIGMGTEKDCDANLLKDIAMRGGGECYFSSDAAEIPRLFAQDTFTITRSALVEEPTALKVSGSMTLLTGTPLGQPPPVGGYNLCFLKPDAHQALSSEDEYSAPITAFWNAGSGRVVCHTAEADGEFAGTFATWERVGEFYCSLGRWVAGDVSTLPPELLVRDEIREGVYRVELHLDPDRQLDPFSGPPVLTVLRGDSESAPRKGQIQFQWKDPDLLVAELTLEGGETVLGRVEGGGLPPVSLAPARLPYSPEFRPMRGNDPNQALQKLAELTGGRERIDLAGMWNELPTQAVTVRIGHWLAMLAMALLLLEIIERRTGLLDGRVKIGRLRLKRERTVSGNVVAPIRKIRLDSRAVAPTPEAAAPVEKPETPLVEASPTLDAMRRARERSKRRSG